MSDEGMMNAARVNREAAEQMAQAVRNLEYYMLQIERMINPSSEFFLKMDELIAKLEQEQRDER